MEAHASSILSFQEDQRQEDAISLCDLSPNAFDDNAEGIVPYYDSSSPSPSRDAFEFSITDTSEETISKVDTILFCGKAIPFEQPRYLLRSDYSFKRLHSLGAEDSDSGDARIARSGSLRFPCSKPAVPATTGSGSCRYSMSSGRRKYKAIIGVTKFPSRMDMDEMRKRQSRQAPAPLFPAGSEGVDSSAITTTGGSRGHGHGHGHWGLLRSLRCRPHLVSALATASFKCMRHV